MCVLIFSTTLVWNISHSKKKWVRYDKKCISVFVWSTGYSCQILMTPELSRQIFRKMCKCKISWKSVQRKPSCSMRTDGRADRNEEAISRFSQLCETRLKTQTLIPGIRNNSVRLWSFIRRWLLCIPPALSRKDSQFPLSILMYFALLSKY